MYLTGRVIGSKNWVNHCKLGQYHMLDKIAHDYVVAIRKPGSNVAKIKYDMKTRAEKLTEIEREKLRGFIQKWLENKNI